MKFKLPRRTRVTLRIDGDTYTCRPGDTLNLWPTVTILSPWKGTIERETPYQVDVIAVD